MLSALVLSLWAGVYASPLARAWWFRLLNANRNEVTSSIHLGLL